MSNRKVYPPFITYCAKVIPLAFNESMSYYECICNITNHINNEIIPKVNENTDIVNEFKNEFIELKNYVDDNMLTKDINDLTYYTLTSDLSTVALTGNYDDLTNKPTIPDVSNFITKDVNDLTYYTLTSNLSTVATTGDYNDLTNKPSIPIVPTNISSFNNDSGYITNTVNDLTNYTNTTALTTLLSNKENAIETGSNTNGNYMKFDDGVMICWNEISVTDQALNSAYGSLYQGSRVLYFPVTFVTAPTVSCTKFRWGTGISWGVATATYTDRVQLYGIDVLSRASGTNVLIGYIAIGYWK